MAKEVKWELDNGEWEALFSENNTKVEVSYNLDGVWVETERSFPNELLPEEVKSTLQHEFKQYTISETEEVQSPSFQGFEISIVHDSTDKEIYISPKGHIHKVEIDE